MDPNTLLVVMAVFVAVSAIALLIQAGLLFGIYKSARGVEESVRRVLPKVEALVETSREVVEDSRKQIAEITTRTTDILDLTRKLLACEVQNVGGPSGDLGDLLPAILHHFAGGFDKRLNLRKNAPHALLHATGGFVDAEQQPCLNQQGDRGHRHENRHDDQQSVGVHIRPG